MSLSQSLSPPPADLCCATLRTASLGLQEYGQYNFIPGLINMSGRACQAKITGSKSEKEMEILQTSGVVVENSWT